MVEEQTTSADFQYRRLPAKDKMIADIEPEKDIRVRIFGRVIDVSNGVLVVDDGSSNSQIALGNLSVDVNPGDMVRVFARVLPVEEGFELHAEIVQNMKGLNVELYKKVKELK